MPLKKRRDAGESGDSVVPRSVLSRPRAFPPQVPFVKGDFELQIGGTFICLKANAVKKGPTATDCNFACRFRHTPRWPN